MFMPVKKKGENRKDDWNSPAELKMDILEAPISRTYKQLFASHAI
jgi:hypothetical protein